jgi:glycerate kinase
VVDASGLDAKLRGADLVITGEGQADAQTGYGKAPGEVAKRAKAARIPVLLIAGSKGPGWEALRGLGVTTVMTLDEEGDNLQQLMRDAGQRLTRTAARACKERAWE